MSKYQREEYDNYTYPEPLKEETPETRKQLDALREAFKEKAKRIRSEAKAREKQLQLKPPPTGGWFFRGRTGQDGE